MQLDVTFKFLLLSLQNFSIQILRHKKRIAEVINDTSMNERNTLRLVNSLLQIIDLHEIITLCTVLRIIFWYHPLIVFLFNRKNKNITCKLKVLLFEIQ